VALYRVVASAAGKVYLHHVTYQKLFEPLAVGLKLTLPNRLVMAPMTTISGEANGEFSKDEIAYLVRRADAGIGLIMTPACYVHKSGQAFDHQVGCHADTMLPRLRECADAINATGAKSFLQIHHGGNAARSEYTGQAPWAPSAVVNRRRTSELPVAMSEKQIEEIVAAFAAGAARAKSAGFTGIELHGANTYLLQQFFSPFTNKRSDRWGCGNWENRVRFSSEVIKAVRSAVGQDYPISYRISPEEPEPDGYSTYDAIRLLETIVPLGIDIVHVSSWHYGDGERHDWPDGTHPVRMIRDAMPSEAPVIGVGGIRTPEQAMRVLDDGVELVAMGTELLIDADWAAKVQSGRSDSLVTRVGSEAEIDRLDIPDRMKTYARRFFPDT